MTRSANMYNVLVSIGASTAMLGLTACGTTPPPPPKFDLGYLDLHNGKPATPFALSESRSHGWHQAPRTLVTLDQQTLSAALHGSTEPVGTTGMMTVQTEASADAQLGLAVLNTAANIVTTGANVVSALAQKKAANAEAESVKAASSATATTASGVSVAVDITSLAKIAGGSVTTTTPAKDCGCKTPASSGTTLSTSIGNITNSDVSVKQSVPATVVYAPTTYSLQ